MCSIVWLFYLDLTNTFPVRASKRNLEGGAAVKLLPENLTEFPFHVRFPTGMLYGHPMGYYDGECMAPRLLLNLMILQPYISGASLRRCRCTTGRLCMIAWGKAAEMCGLRS